MGFTVYYRSTEPVDAQKRAAVEAACRKLCRGRTWLSCEPLCFFPDDDHHMSGGSKPNFMPHPDDVASAQAEGLPDGTIRDALDILCQLSEEYDVDWEISHDYSDGSLGFVRDGRPDPDVLREIETCGSLAELLADTDMDEWFENPNDDDDGEPGIRVFRPTEE